MRKSVPIVTILFSLALTLTSAQAAVYKIKTTAGDGARTHIDYLYVLSRGGHHFLKMTIAGDGAAGMSSVREGVASAAASTHPLERDAVIYRSDLEQLILEDAQRKQARILDHGTQMPGIATGPGGPSTPPQGMPGQGVDLGALIRKKMAEAESRGEIKKEDADRAKEFLAGMIGDTKTSTAPDSIELVPTNRTGTYNRHPTRFHEVRRGKQLIRELEVIDYRLIEGGLDTARAFEKLGNFVEGITSKMGFGSMPAADSFRQWIETGGFIVRSRDFDPQGNVTSTSVLDEIVNQALGLETFETKYQRRGMFER